MSLLRNLSSTLNRVSMASNMLDRAAAEPDLVTPGPTLSSAGGDARRNLIGRTDLAFAFVNFSYFRFRAR